jgi:hypothetical protein
MLNAPVPGVAEQERAGVAQVEHHHRVGDCRIGHVDAGLGDDHRIVVRLFGLPARIEDGVAGIMVELVIASTARADRRLLVLQPAHVAAQLGLDAIGAWSNAGCAACPWPCPSGSRPA